MRERVVKKVVTRPSKKRPFKERPGFGYRAHPNESLSWWFDPLEVKAREFECSVCDAKIGQPCTDTPTKGSRERHRRRAHKTRYSIG